MSPPTNRLRKLSHASVGIDHPSQPSPPHPSQLDPRPTQSLREPYPVPGSNPASQYTLLDKLGTGSFGTVYKALHNETKQIVAIKQIGAVPTSPGRLPFSDLSSF